jgi:hypothetical protein
MRPSRPFNLFCSGRARDWLAFGLISGSTVCLAWPASATAQQARTVVQGYGHLEQTIQRSDGETDAFWSIGTHSLFATTMLTPRVSFLGELTVRPSDESSSGYAAGLERAVVRVRLDESNSVLAGKVHMPVNYWNDSYHHGRLFFPVIDRPLAFSGLVPLHTLGIQVQGQNLGSLNFGYDLMVGNELSASDVFSAGVSPAFLAGAHLRPVSDLWLGVSLYVDHMEENGAGSHTHHSAEIIGDEEPYTGPLDFGVLSTSVSYKSDRLELLHEYSLNRTHTDSLGTALNWSSFAYVGLRATPTVVPYVVVDWLHVMQNDLHNYGAHANREAFGFRVEPDARLVFKAQFERYESFPGGSATSDMGMGMQHDHPPTYGLRLQIAYGF